MSTGSIPLTDAPQAVVAHALQQLRPGFVSSWRQASKDSVDWLIAAHTTGSQAMRWIRLTLGTGSVAQHIQGVLAHLRAIVQTDYPIVYDGVDFSYWRPDPLNRQRLRTELVGLSRRLTGLSPAWAESTLALAAQGQLVSAPQAGRHESEMAQLSLMIQPAGLVLMLEVPPGTAPSQRLVLATVLEWCARHAHAAVVALLPGDWPDAADAQNRWTALNLPPLKPALPVAPPALGTTHPPPAPWSASRVCGKPHGLSEVEKCIFRMLQADTELVGLFSCNQLVQSGRGYHALVDLLWPAGKLVVELDGRPDHSTSQAFERDRHRDYELLLTGYRVLRIANSEVLRDSLSALEKIRDVVRYVQRQQTVAL